MKIKLMLRRDFLPLVSFAAYILIVFSVPIKGNAQAKTAAREEAICKLKAKNKTFMVTANQLGYFDEVSGMSPGEIVSVEIYYPKGMPGEKVIAAVEDGGSFNEGKGVLVMTLNYERKLSFNFKLFDIGNHKISLRKGNVIKVVQLWADRAVNANSSSKVENSLVATALPSANNSKKGTGGKQQPIGGSCTFSVYTGNQFREIIDLEIWGSVGELPLKWVRYGNSRFSRASSPYGNAHYWSSSFFYTMVDNGLNNIKIYFPDGESRGFTQSASNPYHWNPPHGIKEKLFQKDNFFYMQTDSGFTYRFEKLTDNFSTYYQLQDIKDAYQNLYTLTYDINKRLTRVTEPAGRYFQITYDVVNNETIITMVETNDGRKVLYHYTDIAIIDSTSAWVALDSVYYGDGTKASYAYIQREAGDRPRLSHAIDPRVAGNGLNMKYVYDPAEFIGGFTYQEINGVTNTVMATLIRKDSSNNQVCYENGKFEVFNLPTSQRGELNSYTDGLGRKTTYEYYNSGLGFLKSETDALGRITTYNKRTLYGNLLEVTFPDGSKQKWTRDSLDLILTHTDELKRVTTYFRDSKHRVIQIVYPDASFENFTYNAFGKILDHRQRNGGIEYFSYDTSGLLTQFTDAAGNSTLYEYNNAGRLALVKDALGHTTRYNYNERGLIIKMTNADSSFKSYNYDEFGNQTEITDELNHTWITEYDEFRRPLSVTDPLNRITQYEYNLSGHNLPGGGICGCAHSRNKPTKVILPSSKVTEIEYDLEWQKIRETVGAGTPDAAVTFFEYNLVGNLVNVIDPRGKIWETQYNNRNRRISSTNPLGSKTQYQYDLVGNLIKVVRPDSGVTIRRYDNMNRNTQVIDPKGQITKMAYDNEGNMIKLTDPRNYVYRFNYNLMNNRTTMIYPDLKFEGYTYDSISRLKTYATRAGQIKTYIYDNRNREIKTSWFSPFVNDTTPTIISTYDAVNRLLTKSSSISSIGYKYNDGNEITSESQNITGTAVPKTIKYSYTKDGLRDSITYSDGTILKYSYTGRNQLASIMADKVTVAQYHYDLNGNRLDQTFNNATNATYSYDDANQLIKLLNQKSSTPFASFTYGYDNIGRKIFVKRGNGNGDVYSYDPTDQITKVLFEALFPDSIPGIPKWTTSYQWDASGNRKSTISSERLTNYTPNNLNQYIRINDSVLSYGKNANLMKFNSWTLMYDAQNRLISATKSDTVMVFAYDPLNRCVKRTLSKGKTSLYNNSFYYDNWNLIEEHSLDSQITRYVNGSLVDEILTKTYNKNSIYYHYDGLGSVARLTDSAGKMIERYAYDDVFGKTSIRDSNGKVISESAYGNRFMFTGREYLKEITLYDYRNRIYSDSLGRFLQLDPLRFEAGDGNLYRYVFNAPVNYKDPTGEWCIEICLGTWVKVKYKSKKGCEETDAEAEFCAGKLIRIGTTCGKL